MKRLHLLLLLLAFFTTLPSFADADLFLSQASAPPDEYRKPAGSDITLAFTLWNFGPDAARNVVVTLDFPGGLPIRRMYGEGATCDFSRLPLRCTVLEPIPPNQPSSSRFFSLTVGTPHDDTTVTISATAVSDAPDPHPESNTLTRTWTLVNATNFFVNATPLVRVDPGAAPVVHANVSNFIASFPEDVRVSFVATGGLTIEKIVPELSGWSCSINGAAAECRRAALDPNCRCSRDFAVTLRAPSDRSGGTGTLKIGATSSLPDFDNHFLEGLSTVQIYRWLAVTTTADSGPGSLREQIETANRECGSSPCKIAFEIAAPVPASGWFTLEPLTPLPAITASRVNVAGSTQTAFTGNTNAVGPEVAIDGHLTSEGAGLEIRSNCEGVVEGLAIGNFRDHGVIYANGPCPGSTSTDRREVVGNFLGVDPTSRTAWPNLRGIRADDSVGAIVGNVISGNRLSGVWVWRGSPRLSNNFIGVARDAATPMPNGASGVFLGPSVAFAEVLGNTISYNREMGVAIARGAALVDVRQNSMRDNGGIGIDWGLDGPNPPVDSDRGRNSNPPTLLSATYDATLNRTVVTLTLKTDPLGGPSVSNTAQLDFYRNDAPDGDGEQHIWAASVVRNSGEAMTVSIPGDFRGKWINATSTRVSFIFSEPPVARSLAGAPSADAIAGGETQTSELSNAVLVQ